MNRLENVLRILLALGLCGYCRGKCGSPMNLTLGYIFLEKKVSSQLIPSHEVGKVFFMACAVGFEMTEREITATCQQDNTWDYSSKCLPANCPYPSRLKMTTNAVKGHFYNVGEQVRMTCFRGLFLLPEGTVNSLMVTCEHIADGRYAWMPETTCGVIGPPCDISLDLVNSVLDPSQGPDPEGRYAVGTTVSVRCKPGFVASRYKLDYRTECISGGTWNPDLTDCYVDPSGAGRNAFHARLCFKAVVINWQYKESYGDKSSEDYKDLTDSLDRALRAFFYPEYRSMFYGTDMYEFSEAEGGLLEVVFCAVFIPVFPVPISTVMNAFITYIRPRNNSVYDVAFGNTQYQFRDDGGFEESHRIDSVVIDPEKGTCSAAYMYSWNEKLALGFLGALVAGLGMLLMTCCCAKGYCGPLCSQNITYVRRRFARLRIVRPRLRVAWRRVRRVQPIRRETMHFTGSIGTQLPYQRRPRRFHETSF